MIQTVRQILSQSTQVSIVECRDCGASVEPDTESCPNCKSSEIAHYNIGSRDRPTGSLARTVVLFMPPSRWEQNTPQRRDCHSKSGVWPTAIFRCGL